MEIIKNIAIRLILFIAILIGANWIYTKYFLNDFLDVHGSLLLTQIKNSDADYLYYSASSEFSYDAENDTNKSRITKLIDQQTPFSIKPVTSSAHHAGIFAPVIQQLNSESVKGIVVVLNYRSFSPEWIESFNENSLQQSKVLYEDRPHLLNRLLVSLNAYKPLSDQERTANFKRMFIEWKLPYPAPKNTIDSWCMVEKYGDWRNPKRQLADHFIKNYAFVLNENTPRISDFDKISEIAKDKNLQLLFVIIPENMELANELLGSDLTDLMNTNRTYLNARYDHPEQNQHVLDIMDLLNDDNFTDREFPTEHYNYEGRLKVATTISKKLKELNNDN
ncbi:MAG: hypothetical protein ACPGEG_07415 [Salibacteraceae bacterium]